MTISSVEIMVPAITGVSVTPDTLSVDMEDGRTISVPLAWYPRLLEATAEERANLRLIGKGSGIHWDSLDEDISALNLIAGRASGESPKSFARWLASRAGV